MAPTLRRLIADAGHPLALLHAGPGLDEPLTWLSSSDLADPTPFLLERQALLTTGLQFAAFRDAADYRDYVDRLRDSGVVGIGFGTEVVTTGTPAELVDACRASDMTLLEVPYRVPFVALITWAAREIARDAALRDDWARTAQRAISRAAIAGGDVSAALRETARQLRGTIVLFDGAGEISEQHPAVHIPEEILSAVTDDVHRLLRGGKGGASTRRVAGREVLVETVGRVARPSGAVALVTRERADALDRAVLLTGTALVEVAVDRDAPQTHALELLADHALALVARGAPDWAAELLAKAPEVGAIDPEAPLSVMVSDASQGDELRRALARTARRRMSTRLVGRLGPHLVAVTEPEDVEWLESAARAVSASAGISAAHPPSEFALALAHAQAALAVARRDRVAGPRTWDTTSGGRILSALRVAGVAAEADVRLAPIRRRPEGEELLRLTSLWFEHGCRWEPAAAAAGLHRHSLRHRVERLASMLDLNLDEFADRADLWALLELADASR